MLKVWKEQFPLNCEGYRRKDSRRSQEIQRNFLEQNRLTCREIKDNKANSGRIVENLEQKSALRTTAVEGGPMLRNGLQPKRLYKIQIKTLLD